MSYPYAPEFQTSGNGYSPDKFYCQSRFGPTGERRWVSLGRQSFPAEMIGRVEQLIQTKRYPAYKTIGDFLRDATIHHLYRRLSDLDDPFWLDVRDSYVRLIELERIEIEQAMLAETIDRWEKVLNTEKDPGRKRELVEQARADAAGLVSTYWRERLEDVVKRWDR